jgi:aminoglycoside phosphotransferase (APT) family kinase protein
MFSATSDCPITGVIDFQGATSGDATFDLVTAALYNFDTEVRAAGLAEARRRTDPRAVALYAAHIVLRQVDWSLRKTETRSRNTS